MTKITVEDRPSFAHIVVSGDTARLTNARDPADESGPRTITLPQGFQINGMDVFGFDDDIILDPGESTTFLYERETREFAARWIWSGKKARPS